MTDDEIILKFRAAGMDIDLDANFPAKGQIVQLLKGAREVIEECAILAETQKRGSQYQWVKGSFSKTLQNRLQVGLGRLAVHRITKMNQLALLNILPHPFLEQTIASFSRGVLQLGQVLMSVVSTTSFAGWSSSVKLLRLLFIFFSSAKMSLLTLRFSLVFFWIELTAKGSKIQITNRIKRNKAKKTPKVPVNNPFIYLLPSCLLVWILAHHFQRVAR